MKYLLEYKYGAIGYTGKVIKSETIKAKNDEEAFGKATKEFDSFQEWRAKDKLKNNEDPKSGANLYLSITRIEIVKCTSKTRIGGIDSIGFDIGEGRNIKPARKLIPVLS